jgi:hypothetical protein
MAYYIMVRALLAHHEDDSLLVKAIGDGRKERLSLFLYTSDSIIMSVLLLDFFEGGNIGVTAAFSVFQSVLLLMIIGTAHHFTRTTTDLAASG